MLTWLFFFSATERLGALLDGQQHGGRLDPVVYQSPHG